MQCLLTPSGPEVRRCPESAEYLDCGRRYFDRGGKFPERVPVDLKVGVPVRIHFHFPAPVIPHLFQAQVLFVYHVEREPGEAEL